MHPRNRASFPVLVLLVVHAFWLAAALANVVRGEEFRGDILVAAYCFLAVAALLRRTPASYRVLIWGATAGLAGYSLHLFQMTSILKGAVLIYAALGYTALLALMALPAVRTSFGHPPKDRKPWLVVRLLAHGYALAVAALFLFCGAIYAWDALTGTRAPYARIDRPLAAHPDLGIEWKMHRLDNPGDLLPNGLDPADVDGDGWLDFVTNYEARGLIRVAFHPGSRPALFSGGFWPSTNVGVLRNAESSALGDLDGDGVHDVVAIHGVEGTSAPPGVTVFWGRRTDGGPHASVRWIEGGDIPASNGGWHFLYIKTVDLDADGDLDVVVGGRASRMAFGDKSGVAEDPSLRWAGIRWFENPGSTEGSSRDLSRWVMHSIDPASRSGHGFEFGDIDGDDDLDLVNANSDFDTPEEEENVVWYENPGDPDRVRQPWPVHELFRGSEFYAKEQVAIADLDEDGRADVLAVTPRSILWFRNAGTAQAQPVAFETIVIEKHPAAQWRSRPIEVADVNGDGRNDIICALIHDEGKLPKDRPAVFWMERTGEAPDQWHTHVIKWGDGFLGFNYVNGEKWDQMYPYDVDGDGDLDLVANCEEYNRIRSFIAVVWFENEMNGAGGTP